MSRVARRAASWGSCCLALALSSCSGGEKRPPVVVIGVDGLEWSVAEALLKEVPSKMPNLQRLLDEGVGGALQTMVPTWSPVLWTTIATGRPPDAHGIYFFSEWDLEKNQPVPGGLPYTSDCRKVPAIWNLADDAGKSVNSVAWWVSWPAEHLRHGRIVSSYAAQSQGALLWKAGVWKDGLPQLTWPASLANDVAPFLRDGGPDGPAAVAQVQRYGLCPRSWEEPDVLNENGTVKVPGEKVVTRETNYRMSWISDRTHASIFNELLHQEVADLNLVYFGCTDVAGHYFWKYQEPAAYSYPIDPQQVEFFGEHLRKTYTDVDTWLGEILAAMPAERVVMLVADHGMQAYFKNNPKKFQNGGHQLGEPGVFILSGTGVIRRGLLAKETRRLGNIMDVAPMICDLLGIPALVQMPGHSLRSFMTEEWQASHAEPARQSSPLYRRAAGKPTEPIDHANELFMEQLKALGYIDSNGGVDGLPDPAPPPTPEPQPR